MARQTEGFHYTFIHNVFGSFIENTMSFFSDYLYPRFEHRVVGTYDKAVEYITKEIQYGREEDKPNLPAIILNPDGEFNLDEANSGAKSLWRFPSLLAGFSSTIFDPIYIDKNNRITVGMTRLKGTIELLLLLNSFYEYFDLKVYLIQMFGGENRLIEPVVFDSFIIIPPELYNFRYENDATGLSYTLDWSNSEIENKLIKTTNTNEYIIPGKTMPKYILRGMNDASTRHGGIDSLADYRLSAQIEYQVEIPSFLFLETDYLLENCNFQVQYGSCYSEYEDFNNETPQGRFFVNYHWNQDINESSNTPNYTDVTLPDVFDSKEKIEVEFSTRYFHRLTQDDIDSTSNLQISLQYEMFQNEINYIIVNSKYGRMLNHLNYNVINSSVTIIEIERSTLDELKSGDFIEIYIYRRQRVPGDMGTSSTNINTDGSVITLGILKDLTSNSNIVFNTTSNLDLGEIKELQSSINILSNVESTVLTIGKSEILEATSNITSISNDAELVIMGI